LSEVGFVMDQNFYLEQYMEIMRGRIEGHVRSLDDKRRWLTKMNEPHTPFNEGYRQAFNEIEKAIFPSEDSYPEELTEYEFGYWYACLVILGLDTTGLGRS